jgi:hypothetical protein
MKHLTSNQVNWLQLYCMQPLKGKVRKLYMSAQEAFDFLNKECQIIKVEKKNEKDVIHFYNKKYNVNIVLYPTYIVINGMIVGLMKEFEKQKQQN